MEEHDADHESAGLEERDHVPQPGGRLTGATIATVRDRMMKDRTLLRVGEEGLARHFVQAFFSGNAWDVDLAELREVVANLEGCPADVPQDPGRLPAWVREELFEFRTLPRDELAKLYRNASEDLATIDANLEVCRSLVEAVEQRSPKTDSDEVEIRFFRHYEKMNLAARDEITGVLAREIDREALRAAHGPLVSWISLRAPWAMRWNPDQFSPHHFSPIRHAVPDLGIPERERLVAAHRTKSPTFDGLLSDYIRRTDPLSDIAVMLQEHHLLDARKEVLGPALGAYARSEFALFASAVAVQIEGLFEDACALSGVPYDALRLNTLTPKLEALIGSGDFYIDFTYYAFPFQITRNQVAHGRGHGLSARGTADLLLLDLRDACRIVHRHPAPPNALVSLLRSLRSTSASVYDALCFAALFVEVGGQAPAKFYDLAEKFESMRHALEQEPFWSFVGALVGQREPSVCGGVRRLIERLIRLRPGLQRDGVRLLRRPEMREDDAHEPGDLLSVAGRHAGAAASAWEQHTLRSILLGLLSAR